MIDVLIANPKSYISETRRLEVYASVTDFEAAVDELRLIFLEATRRGYIGNWEVEMFCSKSFDEGNVTFDFKVERDTS